MALSSTGFRSLHGSSRCTAVVHHAAGVSASINSTDPPSAHRYEKLTLRGLSLVQISQADQISVKYVGRILQLSLLAPDIVQALEQGD
ncbi:hypothetical protein [Ottowia caeni]|uniref:hypothetical protein n=1 Tax=Ottowia caeni TaxID=2870339 RepID=UPI001E536868|nr:hypothetical protein [Ottowia caeni]